MSSASSLTALDPATLLSAGGALRLPHWGVISAQGADAASFLHGQLSNDITHLGEAAGRLAAFCTPQGRMLASFVVLRSVVADAPAEAAPATPGFWLACRSDLLPAAHKRLAMFVLRAKAKLTDASAELAVLGLAGPAAVGWLARQPGLPTGLIDTTPGSAAWTAAPLAGGRLLRLPGAAGLTRWLWVGPVAEAGGITEALPALGQYQWDAAEVAAGVVPVQAATAGAFVPQMLNYELVGGVDFKKGCYPGQEVVARSHYLGKLKRRGVLLQATALPAQGEAAPRAAQEVWWSGDAAQPAGQVAQAAALGGAGTPATTDTSDWLLLAELKLAALDEGRLHLGSLDGPRLQRLPLPYALPQETADAAA